MKEQESEFGRGFTYCIGLFLAHAERPITEWNGKKNYGIWFNVAADHLYDLEIPDTISKELQGLASELQDKCIALRMGCANKAQYLWAIQRAKDILLAYDIECGIKAVKGQYE